MGTGVWLVADGPVALSVAVSLAEGGDRLGVVGVLGVQLPDPWGSPPRHPRALLPGEQPLTPGWTFRSTGRVPSARMPHWSPSPSPAHPALGPGEDGDPWAVPPHQSPLPPRTDTGPTRSPDPAPTPQPPALLAHNPLHRLAF